MYTFLSFLPIIISGIVVIFSCILISYHERQPNSKNSYPKPKKLNTEIKNI